MKGKGGSRTGQGELSLCAADLIKWGSPTGTSGAKLAQTKWLTGDVPLPGVGWPA